MAKVLVVYYSLEGSTKKIAEAIAESIGADLLPIRPIQELKSKGFSKYFWGGSQVVMKKKPGIYPLEVDLDQYDLFLVGTPIWAGTFAPPIHTFLELKEFNHKRVAYFYTHEGGCKRAEEKMKIALDKNQNFMISAKGFLNPLQNLESSKAKSLDWVEEVMGTFFYGHLSI